MLDFCSKMAKKIVRPITAGKVYALVESFDAAFPISKKLEFIHKKTKYIDIFTDSKHIFDAVTKGGKTTGKRLMIIILATPEAYLRFEICIISLVWRKQNPADTLSKWTENDILKRLIETRLDDTPVLPWIDWSYVQTSTIATEEEV